MCKNEIKMKRRRRSCQCGLQYSPAANRDVSGGRPKFESGTEHAVIGQTLTENIKTELQLTPVSKLFAATDHSSVFPAQDSSENTRTDLKCFMKEAVILFHTSCPASRTVRHVLAYSLVPCIHPQTEEEGGS